MRPGPCAGRGGPRWRPTGSSGGGTRHHAADESAPDAWTEEGGWAGPRWGPPRDAGRRLDAKVWRLLLAAGVLLAVMMIVDIAVRG